MTRILVVDDDAAVACGPQRTRRVDPKAETAPMPLPSLLEEAGLAMVATGPSFVAPRAPTPRPSRRRRTRRPGFDGILATLCFALALAALLVAAALFLRD